MYRYFGASVLAFVLNGCTNTQILTQNGLPKVPVNSDAVLVLGGFWDENQSVFVEKEFCTLFKRTVCIISRDIAVVRHQAALETANNIDLITRKEDLNKETGLLSAASKLGVTDVVIVSPMPFSELSYLPYEAIEHSGNNTIYNRTDVNDAFKAFGHLDKNESIRIVVIDAKTWKLKWAAHVLSNLDYRADFNDLIKSSVKELDNKKIFN